MELKIKLLELDYNKETHENDKKNKQSQLKSTKEDLKKLRQARITIIRG